MYIKIYKNSKALSSGKEVTVRVVGGGVDLIVRDEF